MGKRRGKKVGKRIEMGDKKAGGLKIVVLVERDENDVGEGKEEACNWPNKALYVIDIPGEEEEKEDDIDDGTQGSECFKNPKPDSPSMLIPNGELIDETAFVKLGNKIYMVGGISNGYRVSNDNYKNLLTTVKVLDTKNLHLGLRPVASLNYPKDNPCTFVADGYIYVIGRRVGISTGVFERYLPASDTWEVLPDPPLSCNGYHTIEATVVGRRVYIGNFCIHCIFDLDSQKWIHTPSADGEFFPHGALCVGDSLYHFRGGDISARSYVDEAGHLSDPIHIVKRSAKNIKDTNIMATSDMLQGDDNCFFTHPNFHPWRQLFHLEGPFFCVIVTSQLVDFKDRFGFSDYHSRGIGIQVFREDSLHNTSNNKDQQHTHFTLVASFFHKFHTIFPNSAVNVCACVLGSVPHSWKTKPLKKDMIKVGFKETEARDTKIAYLKKRLEAKEKEASRIAAEVGMIAAKLAKIETAPHFTQNFQR